MQSHKAFVWTSSSSTLQDTPGMQLQMRFTSGVLVWDTWKSTLPSGGSIGWLTVLDWELKEHMMRVIMVSVLEPFNQTLAKLPTSGRSACGEINFIQSVRCINASFPAYQLPHPHSTNQAANHRVRLACDRGYYNLFRTENSNFRTQVWIWTCQWWCGPWAPGIETHHWLPKRWLDQRRGDPRKRLRKIAPVSLWSPL